MAAADGSLISPWAFVQTPAQIGAWTGSRNGASISQGLKDADCTLLAKSLIMLFG